MTKTMMAAIIAAIKRIRASATDESALDAIELYPVWRTGTAYTVDERIRYGATLYRCVQAHTSQADWTPDKTPALWTVVSLDEWPEWKQPAGAHDAYMKGDKVSHNGKHWVCDMDYCTYEPGVYGWTTMED